jgi:hypothetical protein
MRSIFPHRRDLPASPYRVLVVITQHPLARALAWSMTVVGLLGAGMIAVAPIPVAVRAFLAALSVTAGVLLSRRAARMYVEVRQGTLTIHGWLRPRSVPVRQVTGVTRFPAVTWEDEFGRGHFSPLWMLAANPSFGLIVRHNEAALRQLARALHHKLTP